MEFRSCSKSRGDKYTEAPGMLRLIEIIRISAVSFFIVSQKAPAPISASPFLTILMISGPRLPFLIVNVFP